MKSAMTVSVFIRSLNPTTQDANGRFGAAVANAGNVGHDGVDDILIAAPSAQLEIQ